MADECYICAVEGTTQSPLNECEDCAQDICRKHTIPIEGVECCPPCAYVRMQTKLAGFKAWLEGYISSPPSFTSFAEVATHLVALYGELDDMCELLEEMMEDCARCKDLTGII